MSRFYMRGKRILYDSYRLYAKVKKTNDRNRYDIYKADGSFMCSIFKYVNGFGISSTTSRDNISVYASKKKTLRIGLGLRLLLRPIISLLNLPCGPYTGAFGHKSLVITRKTIEVDGRITARYSGANVGYLNAFLSGITYGHQHIDISDSVSDVDKYIAIYAYLYYIAT